MRLLRLEARLRQLLEVRLMRILPGRRPQDLLVQHLTHAIENSVRVESDGARVAPNVYTLQFHPSARSRWQTPPLVEALPDLIRAAASDAGLRFKSPPALAFAEDSSLPVDGLKVVASHTAEAVGKTQDVAVDTDAQRESENAAAAIPPKAFLIVDGVKEFPLATTVINIGRRLDNDLVVDDPRVSRHHAQLRAIKGRYVLFDLNSSGGTFINGQRTSQTVLYPGDVISLAGVSLIFGQDIALPQRDLGKTGPRSQAGAERPTAIIRNIPSGFRKKE